MGDALLNAVRDCFKLSTDEEGQRCCPKCGGYKFRVKLEQLYYVTTLLPEDSWPDIDSQQPGPIVTEVACLKCGFNLEFEDKLVGEPQPQ